LNKFIVLIGEPAQTISRLPVGASAALRQKDLWFWPVNLIPDSPRLCCGPSVFAASYNLPLRYVVLSYGEDEGRLVVLRLVGD
jgi:hypothetical protein